MDDMDDCIKYLWESDQPYADAKAKVRYLDKKLKVVKATAFLKAKGTGEVRKAESEVDPLHLDALEEYREACLVMETNGVRRETINIRVEVWRTRSANSRKGNV